MVIKYLCEGSKSQNTSKSRMAWIHNVKFQDIETVTGWWLAASPVPD